MPASKRSHTTTMEGHHVSDSDCRCQPVRSARTSCRSPCVRWPIPGVPVVSNLKPNVGRSRPLDVRWRGCACCAPLACSFFTVSSSCTMYASTCGDAPPAPPLPFPPPAEATAARDLLCSSPCSCSTWCSSARMRASCSAACVRAWTRSSRRRFASSASNRVAKVGC